MELLNEFGTFSSFLTNLNPHELLKYGLDLQLSTIALTDLISDRNKVAKMNAPWKRDRVAPASDEESDKEANFESKPRPFNSDWTKEESGRLPIKMEDGRIEIPALPAPGSSLICLLSLYKMNTVITFFSKCSGRRDQGSGAQDCA